MRTLTADDRGGLLTLLREHAPANIFLLGALYRAEHLDDRLADDGEFWAPSGGGPLRAGLYATRGGLNVPFGTDMRELESMAWKLRSRIRSRLLVGPRAATDALWKGLHLGVEPRLVRPHRLYVLAAADLKVPADPTVRVARARDLDTCYEMAARMQTEELGIDPRVVDPGRFRRRIARLIMDGVLWVMPHGEGFGFQASASSYCDEGTQVEAVFTPPRLRGRGCATRGLAGMCAGLLDRYPLVTLHVNEANRQAIKLYERLGFRATDAFRLISV